MAHSLVRRQRAQILVFFALALPLVLLPIAAYAVDASVAAAAYARLVEVTAQAAEEAVQQIEIGRLRAGDGISIDTTAAVSIAKAVVEGAEPGARVIDFQVLGYDLRLISAETVVLPFNVFGSPTRELHASVEARIVPGYESPSSRFPFPVSTF